MSVVVSPTELQIATALRTFVLSVVPSNTPVILGLQNRVPEPTAGNFVVMTPIRRTRLATNLHLTADCSFTASFSGATMTVSAVDPANGVAILVGASVIGPGVPLAIITAQTSGTIGGVGTYTVSPSYTAGPGTYAAGQLSVLEMVEIAFQVAFHSPDGSGADMAQAVRMMLRDPYAVAVIGAVNANVTPLYGSDARQAPFVNAEDQYENRWVIDAMLQANVTLTGLSQDFVTTLALSLVDVDVVYPP